MRHATHDDAILTHFESFFGLSQFFIEFGIPKNPYIQSFMIYIHFLHPPKHFSKYSLSIFLMLLQTWMSASLAATVTSCAATVTSHTSAPVPRATLSSRTGPARQIMVRDHPKPEQKLMPEFEMFMRHQKI